MKTELLSTFSFQFNLILEESVYSTRKNVLVILFKEGRARFTMVRFVFTISVRRERSVDADGPDRIYLFIMLYSLRINLDGN